MLIDGFMEKDLKNVICIKWKGSSKYTAEYVNKLYNSILRNTTYPINFYCFTDDDKGLDKNIIAKPLPVMNVDDLRYAYRKEAGLCEDNLGGLAGQRVLFFDLDTVVVNNIDGFFELPKDDEFYIINDWNNKNRVGQASCYSWVVGTLGYVKDDFEKDPLAIYKKYYTASQEYLSDKVKEKYGKLNFWPKEWARSFRFDCLPTPLIPFLRKFKMAGIPKNAKIICFHGMPKPEEAELGKWPEKHLWKKFFYKHLRPVKWVADHWR